MIIRPIKLIAFSENGERGCPTQLEITMDGSQPDCPITFWKDGAAIFSMGCDEVSDFAAALESLSPNS